MKQIGIGMIMLIVICGRPVPAAAQSQEVQQLLLNITKLAQFKAILQQMYDGYKVLESGYNKVRDIANGNYKLHQVFLDGLLAVNPEVKNYYKVAEIVQLQIKLVKEYKVAIHMFKASHLFNPDELSYFEKVYKGLLDESLANLDALLTVVTAGKVRMSDDERMQAIDELHTSMQVKWSFLRHFNEDAHLLAMQKAKEKQELSALRKWHDIK
jgi:hypothetical protein